MLRAKKLRSERCCSGADWQAAHTVAPRILAVIYESLWRPANTWLKKGNHNASPGSLSETVLV